MYNPGENHFLNNLGGDFRDSTRGRKKQSTELTQLEKDIKVMYQDYDQKRPNLWILWIFSKKKFQLIQLN